MTTTASARTTGSPTAASKSRHAVASKRAWGSVKYLTLVLGSIVTLLPLLVLVNTAFKTQREFATTAPLQAPGSFLNFDNFVIAFNQGNMAVGFRNTAIVLAVSLVGTILLGSMTAYAIDRFEFRFRKAVFGLFLLATLIPGVTTQVATFRIIVGLGLFDNLLALIVLNLGTDVISVYIFVQFMRSIPKDLDEAAMLDGANKFTIYWRVILPLLKPAIVTVTIIKGIAIYNEFYQPFLYTPSPENAVISTALFAFKGPYGSQWQIISAGALIVIVPTLAIFLVLQRYIYNGFTQGASK